MPVCVARIQVTDSVTSDRSTDAACSRKRSARDRSRNGNNRRINAGRVGCQDVHISTRANGAVGNRCVDAVVDVVDRVSTGTRERERSRSSKGQSQGSRKRFGFDGCIFRRSHAYIAAGRPNFVVRRTNVSPDQIVNLIACDRDANGDASSDCTAAAASQR